MSSLFLCEIRRNYANTLIGCGAIGSVIGKAILAHEIKGVQLVTMAEVLPSEEVKKWQRRAVFLS